MTHGIGQLKILQTSLVSCAYLVFSTDNFPCYLEDALSICVWVECPEPCGDAVVFPHPDGVHGGKGRLLIGALITGNKAWRVGRDALLVLLVKWQEGFAGRGENADLQFPDVGRLLAQALLAGHVTAIHVGAVDVGRDRVELLPNVRRTHTRSRGPRTT
jgi:hypothetical protein